MSGDKPRKRGFGIFQYRFDTAGRGPTLWGYLALVPFLLLLGGWAALAPLSAAAIAPGSVVLNKDRKVIQHLEGGLVDNVLVSEGDYIKAGAPLIVIRDVAQRTQINTLYDQLAASRALQTRLIAERDQADSLDFSNFEDGIDLPAEKFKELRTSQTHMFDSRRNAVETKIELIKARQKSTEQEIVGLKRQLKAATKQMNLSNQELSSIKDLYNKKLVTANRYMAVERDQADFEGQVGQIAASIARAEQQIATAEIEIIDLKIGNRNQILEDLQKVELNIHELTQQITEMRDELARTVIKAPVSGRVMDIQFQTKGAVVRAGERIMDIVPDDDRLIIEARVSPVDIDLVHRGTKTKVQLSAYKSKKVPRLDGEVISVSADILSDPQAQQSFFLARVLVDEKMLHNLKGNIILYPGMPAQVFLLAGERTLADYLLSPFFNATYRAFREE